MNLVPFKNNRLKLNETELNIKSRDEVITSGKWGECKWRIKGDTLEIYGDDNDPNHVYKAESIVYDFDNRTTNAPWISSLEDVKYLYIYIYII